jgi:hypothetical protein
MKSGVSNKSAIRVLDMGALFAWGLIAPLMSIGATDLEWGLSNDYKRSLGSPEPVARQLRHFA